MTVYDRWHKSRPKPGEPVCREHGKVPASCHGEGDRWQVRGRDDTGRQFKENFAKRSDADARDATVRVSLAAGAYISHRTGKTTLREYAKGWLAASTADPASREGAEIKWRVHILPALGDVQLGRLATRPSLIQSFVADLTRNNMAENYVRTILASLSAALSAADRLIAANPCASASVKAPRVPSRRVIPWTAAQVGAVQEGLPGHYRATVDAGAGLGLRQGEAFGLGIEDIDFMCRAVHVRRQVRLIGGELVFGPPKGGKERDVPLPGSVSLRLSAHIASRPPVAITLPWREPGARQERATLLFTSLRGAALNKNSFNAGWRTALDSAKMPRRRENGFHALRHYFASVLLAEGVDIRALSEYLGHHDPGFTLRTYTHMMPSAPDRMRAAVDSAFAGPAARPQTAGAQ